MKEQSQEKKGTFGTYLSMVQQKRSAEQQGDDEYMNLLSLLSETEAKPLPEILKDSHLSVSQLTTSLQTLETLDMVTVNEHEGSKVVSLTKGGAEFLKARGADI